MVIGSLEDECGPESMSGTQTLTRDARTTQGTPKMVASDVVTTSLSDKERTLTVTPSRSFLGSE